MPTLEEGRDPRALNSAKAPDDQKSAMIYVRATMAEKNQWVRLANKAKLTLADYIRAALVAYGLKKKD